MESKNVDDIQAPIFPPLSPLILLQMEFLHDRGFSASWS